MDGSYPKDIPTLYIVNNLDFIWYYFDKKKTLIHTFIVNN